MISSFSEPIYCPNLSCPEPRNTFGRQHCAACETALIYRYLWAVGPAAEAVPAGQVIADRYFVIAPQIWLDSRPSLPPSAPEQLPDTIMPYLHLYPQRLHTPEVYGFCSLGEAAEATEVLLLENVPVNNFGSLNPSILQAWSGTTAARQVYWLWQMLQLWTPLSEQGVASSLLVPENLRVEGWRVRLLELHKGNFVPTLKDLGDVWSGLVESARPEVQSRLGEICQFMRRSSMNFDALALELNDLLLEEAAKLPLHLEVVGMTDTGPQRSQNEDSCYPIATDLQFSKTSGDKLIPYLTMVCDGVGGHEGGEVASQLAVHSLKSLIQNLLAEIAEQQELMTPVMVIKQLEEIVRVVNNVISAQNNEQGKELRERMGTTLVMALQLPQKIKISDDLPIANSHELYLVNVGDSRAYWIGKDYCHRLTVDDDVASREVQLGHSLYWETQLRSDAGALTQALGTRDGDFLRPIIQRFIVEEEGLLLLCSDGLTDNDWVEQSWENYGPPVLDGKMSLESAVQSWIRLANEKNGYDNTSVVATHCRMSPERLVLFPPATASTGVSLPMSASVSLPASASMSLPQSLQKSGRMPESQLSESSKQLLYAESSPAEPVQKTQKSKLLLPLLGLLVLMLGGGALGLWVRSLQSPQPEPEPLPPPPETIAPTPADIPSPGAEIPSPSPESTPAEIPSPSPESTPAEIPSPSPESTPAEIPLPDAESPSPSPQ